VRANGKLSQKATRSVRESHRELADVRKLLAEMTAVRRAVEQRPFAAPAVGCP
jgi:hypothetical protein